MLPLKFVEFSIVIFSVYFIQSAVTSPDENVKIHGDFCECPPFAPKIDFLNVDDVKKAQIFLVETLWNNMKLSAKGKELEEIIFDLIRSDDTFWKETALTCTVWTYSNVAKAESERNLCKFAKLINATIPWQTNKDCSVMATAIDDVVQTIKNAAYNVVSAGLKTSECGPGVIIPDPPTCFENGTIYGIVELWDHNGGKLPNRLREITMTLYQSNDYIDQLLAVVTTGSLSLPLRNTVMHFNPNVLYGLLHASTSPKLEVCCCQNYRYFVNYYLEILEAVIGPYAKAMKELAKCD